jgi:acyl carrier protein
MAHATYTPTEVAATVDRILSDVLASDAPLTPEMTITGDLRADSLDVVEIAIVLEETFGIEVQDSQLDDGTTVGDLRALAVRLLADQDRLAEEVAA